MSLRLRLEKKKLDKSESVPIFSRKGSVFGKELELEIAKATMYFGIIFIVN